MILIISPSKPLLFTPKGTLRRKVTLEQYTEEIDALYKAVDESAQEGITGPADWSAGNSVEFVRKAVEKTMKEGGRDWADSADLFEIGLDRYDSSILIVTAVLISTQSSSDLDSQYATPRSSPIPSVRCARATHDVRVRSPVHRVSCEVPFGNYRWERCPVLGASR